MVEAIGVKRTTESKAKGLREGKLKGKMEKKGRFDLMVKKSLNYHRPKFKVNH